MTREARFEAFRQRYKAGEIIVGMSCSTMSPVLTEIFGHAGLDFVIVDTEHLAINPETVENMVRAAECSGTIPMIKLKQIHPVDINNALNTGAPIVKVPHVTSADDLRAALDAAYFHPRGHRGLCSVSRANRYAQGKMASLIEWTNREVQVIPIIEDQEAVERIDEIMAVEGVDIYDVGAVDLAHSYGCAPDLGFGNAVVGKALDRIVASAKRHGKHVMTLPHFGKPLSPTVGRELIERGVRIIFYRTDSVALRGIAADACSLRTPAS